MADLNFPKNPSELVPPKSEDQFQTGDTYTANGTTWVYDAAAGAWGSGTGAVVDAIYLSRVNDDTADGNIEFKGLTTHQQGVQLPNLTNTTALATDVNGNIIAGTSGDDDSLTEDDANALYLSKTTNDTAQGSITFKSNVKLDSLKNKNVLGTDANGNIVESTSVTASSVKTTSATNNLERNVLVKNTEDTVNEVGPVRFSVNGPTVQTNSGRLSVPGGIVGDLTGNADTVSTGSSFDSTNNRPLACFGSSITPQANSKTSIRFPANNPPTVNGNGKITANGGFDGNLTGNASSASRVSTTSASNNQERNILVKNTEDNTNEVNAVRFSVNGPTVQTNSGRLTAPNGFVSSKDMTVNNATLGTKGEGNVCFGLDVLNGITSGNFNAAIGRNACKALTTGSYNTAVGNNSLTAVKGGSNNTAVGNFALSKATSGNNNVAVGQNALKNITVGSGNTALGVGAGEINQSGNNNTNTEFSTMLGQNSRVSGNNQIQLGSSSSTTYAYGAVQNRSDLRDKTAVRDTILGLDFLKSLRPVDFKWDMRDDYIVRSEVMTADGSIEPRYTSFAKDGSRKRSRYHHGLIAQEVKAALDSQNVDFGGYQDHSIDGGDDVLTIGYTEFIGPLIRAVQELSDKNEQLEARLAALEGA